MTDTTGITSFFPGGVSGSSGQGPGGQGQVDLSIQLQNLNAIYNSESKQGIQTILAGVAVMGLGAVANSGGIFLVGVLVALYGYSRYQGALNTLAQRDNVSSKLVLGAEVKV